MQQFGQSITISTPTTLAAAMRAAGWPDSASNLLSALMLRTSDTVAVFMSRDGVTEPGARQVETNTVVAAAGITGNGNARSVVTAVGMTGTPKTVTVAVTTAAHTTAALIATAFRTALGLDADVSAFFDIGGTGAIITLTRKVPAPNDATMNFTIEDVTSAGITEDTSSDNTTPGSLGGILIDDAPFQVGDGSAPIVDAGTCWLIPTGSATIQIFAQG